MARSKPEHFIGPQLKALMAQRGMDNHQLAALVGYSEPHIRSLLNGNRGATLAFIRAVQDKTGVLLIGSGGPVTKVVGRVLTNGRVTLDEPLHMRSLLVVTTPVRELGLTVDDSIVIEPWQPTAEPDPGWYVVAVDDAFALALIRNNTLRLADTVHEIVFRPERYPILAVCRRRVTDLPIPPS